VYRFIVKASIYTIDKGVGMGLDVAIAPDILKVNELGKEKGIDIFLFEEYMDDFVSIKSKLEQKKD
jgi:hypothetical protein